eukprot:UN02493
MLACVKPTITKPGIAAAGWEIVHTAIATNIGLVLALLKALSERNDEQSGWLLQDCSPIRDRPYIALYTKFPIFILNFSLFPVLLLLIRKYMYDYYRHLKLFLISP